MFTKADKDKIVTSLIFLFVLMVHFWFITYGTWNLSGEEVRGSAFDSLGKSLLSHECSVDLKAISEEGFHREGKVYMYFGPFPALLRIVFNFLCPTLYGNWSRISCLSASFFCLLAFVFILKNQLNLNNNLSDSSKGNISNIFLLAFGLGSPLLFLMSCGYIYHEAEIWAFCFSMWGIYFLFSIFNSSNKEHLKIKGKFHNLS